MRRREKEMAKDFLAVLAKAHYEIKKAVGRENKEQACPLLAQCQQGAMELGDLIASTEGEDCPIIGLLEDYCELVNQIYDALERERPKSPEGIYQRLKKKLTKLERCLEEEVPLHREAVFSLTRCPCGIRWRVYSMRPWRIPCGTCTSALFRTMK